MTEPSHKQKPPTERGWMCPNCGKAHAPDVKTCPAPSNKTLRERIVEANNG